MHSFTEQILNEKRFDERLSFTLLLASINLMYGDLSHIHGYLQKQEPWKNLLIDRLWR